MEIELVWGKAEQKWSLLVTQGLVTHWQPLLQGRLAFSSKGKQMTLALKCT